MAYIQSSHPKRGASPMNINFAVETNTGAPSFQVERLGARLGAEIHGLDLRNGMDADTFGAFEAALIEHKVIVLRDQHLTTDQHISISRLFGELEVHPKIGRASCRERV